MRRILAISTIIALALLLVPCLLMRGKASVNSSHTTGSSAQVQTPRVQVVLLQNAGEPDQSFDLTSDDDFNSLRSFLTDLVEVSDPAWPALGERGFQLFNDGVADLPLDIRVFQGVIRIEVDEIGHFFIDERGLESWLTERAMKAGIIFFVPPGPIGVESASESFVKLPVDKTDGKNLPTSGSEPPYEPDRWNARDVQRNNNCYNYARNTILDGFGRPGRGTPREPPAPGQPGYTCASFVAAAQADGLTVVNCDNACPAGSYKVALVLDPDGDGRLPADYHWYRQDSNGRWSHKPGSGEATDRDSSGNQITDPRTADRRRRAGAAWTRGYRDFCGCFCVRVPARR